jgi:hypothetical protein
MTRNLAGPAQGMAGRFVSATLTPLDFTAQQEGTRHRGICPGGGWNDGTLR